ncbi:unnamed protein product, partial [Cyberlindnera jadinii]
MLSVKLLSTAVLTLSTLAAALPEPAALAISDEGTCATSACRTSCNLMIIGGTQCTSNTTNPYAGPYDTDCLCSSNSNLMRNYAACLECGWTLWNNYGPYASSALAACGLPTEPTGTVSCSTAATTTVANCIEEGNCLITNAAPVQTVKTTAVDKPAYTVKTTSKASSETSSTTNLGAPAYAVTSVVKAQDTTTLAAAYTVRTTGSSQGTTTLAGALTVSTTSSEGTTNLGAPAYAVKSAV